MTNSGSRTSGSAETADGGEDHSELTPRDERQQEKISGVSIQEEEWYDYDEKGPWFIPEGAAMIVKQIASEQIFLEMVDCVMDPDHNTNHDALFHLLRQYPGLCHRTYKIKWEDGAVRELYPLSLLCCLQAPLHLLKTVYEANPAALHHREAVKGTLAFHYACTFQAPLEVIDWMLDLDPTLLNCPRVDGMYGLHLAVFFKAPMGVVNRLMTIWPEGLVQDYTGEWSLLHAAAAGHASLEIVQRVYEASPESITCLDERLRTPLHQACWKRGNPSVVDFLMEKGPQVLYMEDDGGETPLVRAARTQSVEVLRLLLPDDPPADELGANLLHFAGIDNTADVVEFLLERHPEMATAHTIEQDRYTPLHSASHFCSNVAVMEALVRHNPETLLALNGHGKTPLETARQFNPSREIIEFLESVTPATETPSDAEAEDDTDGDRDDAVSDSSTSAETT